MPIEELKINGKEMKAIGVSYDTDKLFRVLQIEAFQGQSNLYVIHEDGTEVFSAVNSEGVKGYNLLNSLEKLTFKNGSPEEFRRGLETGTVILFLPKPDLIPGAASSLILQRGIVPLSGIDIGVAKHIGHQIDVACLPVQVGAIGAAQLVRGDWF